LAIRSMEKRIEIDLFFDELPVQVERRRWALQTELLEVCERETKRLASQDKELKLIRERCESGNCSIFSIIALI
jgi:hypothetical protein